MQFNQTSCPLCQTVGGTLWYQADKFRIVEAEDNHYPGYCRIIWQSHACDMSDLLSADRNTLFKALILVEEVLKRIMRCNKINLASFGNQIPHLHWHITPRYTDDRHFPESIWGKVQREDYPEKLAIRHQYASCLQSEIKKIFDKQSFI